MKASIFVKVNLTRWNAFDWKNENHMQNRKTVDQPQWNSRIL